MRKILLFEKVLFEKAFATFWRRNVAKGNSGLWKSSVTFQMAWILQFFAKKASVKLKIEYIFEKNVSDYFKLYFFYLFRNQNNFSPCKNLMTLAMTLAKNMGTKMILMGTNRVVQKHQNRACFKFELRWLWGLLFAQTIWPHWWQRGRPRKQS